MTYLAFNRKSLLFATLLASSFGANAQIHSTHTDEKYNYTTVVYKDKTATDKDVLTALDNSVGMGDVVRVTVAPPKPAVTPAVDKAKGEDIWLNHKPVTASGLTAATTAATTSAKVSGLSNLADKTIHTTPRAVPAKAAPVAAPAPSLAAVKPVKAAPAAPKAALSPVAAPSTVEAATVARKTSVAKTTTAKSGKKVVKKSTRKSGNGYKKTSRKAGKQRYGCPRF